MDTDSDKSINTKISAIDKALAAAKARKASRAAATPPVGEMIATKKTHPEFMKAQRAEASKKLSEDRAARRAQREARKLEQQSTSPTHMKKVSRAGDKLPSLGDAARSHLDELTTNLSRVDLAALALHIQHFNRVKATEMSTGRRFKSGQKARIVAGDLAHIGKIGVVESGRPLRCFVSVPGVKRLIYVFTSEIEAVEDEPAAQSTGTEG